MPIPQQRFWHYIRGNARSSAPSNLLFFKTITMPHRKSAEVSWQMLRCWTAIALRLEKGKVTRRAMATSNLADDFWSFVETRLDKRRPLWMFSCNIAFNLIALGFGNVLQTQRFVIAKTRTELSNEDGLRTISEREGLAVLDKARTIVEMWHDNTDCKAYLLDTKNYYRENTLSLSQSVGLQQLVKPALDQPMSDWQAFSYRETEIIERAIVELIRTVREHDLGNFRYTITAQSMQAYRHRFMQHKILVHCNEKALRLERNGYFGGDCTLYRYGKVDGPIYVLDAKSFYPNICLQHCLPYTLVRHEVYPISPASLRWTWPNWILARVVWDSNTYSAPIRYRGRLVKAIGKFETTLHSPELAFGIERGCIQQVREFALYQQGKIFAKYMQEMLRLRDIEKQRGDKVREKLFKMLANGLTGKTGQRQIDWIDCPNTEAPFAWGTWRQCDSATKKAREFRSINWRVQKKRFPGEAVNSENTSTDSPFNETPATNDESTNSCPVIAGAITSWGRVILQRYIDIAGRENVFYTDTDCLHVGAKGFEALSRKIDTNDGMFSILGNTGIYNEAEYFGQKFYRLDDTWTVAGIKSTAERIDGQTFRQFEYSGWNSLVAHGPAAQIEESRITIDRSKEWIPGKINDDGTIEPLAINLEQE